MQLSKNKKYQYIFFLLILIYSVFNGGNSNLLIQINFLLSFFHNQLAFNENLKLIYLILSVVLGLLFYLFVSYWIKAFKISDIKLKY